MSTCPSCSNPLTEKANFCASCGTRIVPESTTAAIDSYIRTRLDKELSARLQDEKTLVRELADKVEDVVRKRLWLLNVLIGLVIAFFGFLGFNTLDGVSKRIEPVVAKAEQRVQAAQQSIDASANRIEALKGSVDKLSTDVDAQKKRVSEKGGEISDKLRNIETSVTATQKSAGTYQSRLDAMERDIDSRLQKITARVDNLTVKKNFPTLGRQLYVTYDDTEWQGASTKKKDDKWISIAVDFRALSDFTEPQMEKVMSDLKASGFTTFPGRWGVAGPYSTSLGAFLSPGGTTVLYFKKESEQLAETAANVVEKALSKGPVKTLLMDPGKLSKDDVTKMIIERSGLDCQLVFGYQQ